MRSDNGICEQMATMITDCMDIRPDMHPYTREQLMQTIDMLRITDVMVCCSEELLRGNVTEDQYLEDLDAELADLQAMFVSERYGGKA